MILNELLSCIQDRLFRAQRGHAILCDQWIKDQAAIDAPEYGHML
jgi:hypothetical protein